MHIFVRVRADSGADTGPDGAGIHIREDNPLVPPGPAAGAGQTGRQHCLARRV